MLARRVLLDIQEFAAKQTVSVSHISSEVVDRFVGAFNREVVPTLASDMSSGVANKLQDEFRPTMQRMNETLETLGVAIASLEEQKQESVTGEIRVLVKSLEESIVGALSTMGNTFHSALTGAASQEFGNVQGTLEATRQMLSEMNTQFASMQAAFSRIIDKASEATTDHMKAGREQTEALTSLMNGLMLKLQESAEQNLGNVRNQLTMVVADLSERVGSLSQEMMAAASAVATQAQASTKQILGQSGEWSEATARRLEGLMANIEARSQDFQAAGISLLAARDLLREVISQNAVAVERMMDASKSVQAYSTSLAGQGEALKSLTQLQAKTTEQIKDAIGTLRASSEHGDRLLTEHRRTFDSYKAVIDELDVRLAKVLTTLHAGLRDYNQTIEKNWGELVKIANPMISEAASFLNQQIKELSEQLDELTNAISKGTERVNGRTQ